MRVSVFLPFVGALASRVALAQTPADEARRSRLLDEATTNMDEANSKLVLDLMDHYIGDRLLIFASNRPEEFGRFARKIEMKNASASR